MFRNKFFKTTFDTFNFGKYQDKENTQFDEIPKLVPIEKDKPFDFNKHKENDKKITITNEKQDVNKFELYKYKYVTAETKPFLCDYDSYIVPNIFELNPFVNFTFENYREKEYNRNDRQKYSVFSIKIIDNKVYIKGETCNQYYMTSSYFTNQHYCDVVGLDKEYKFEYIDIEKGFDETNYVTQFLVYTKRTDLESLYIKCQSTSYTLSDICLLFDGIFDIFLS